MPKIDIGAITERRGSGYPQQFREPFAGRIRKALGRAGGLTQFGVNLCRLEPGAPTSIRHWHENEDEFIYVLEGEVVLVENTGETVLRAGDAAAFQAGMANGHCLENRSDREALILEVGTRAPEERAHYSDIDMMAEVRSGSIRYLHRDGTPYAE